MYEQGWMPTSTLFKKVEHFSKIRSYSRLSSKFDGRDMLVNVLQEHIDLRGCRHLQQQFHVVIKPSRSIDIHTLKLVMISLFRRIISVHASIELSNSRLLGERRHTKNESTRTSGYEKTKTWISQPTIFRTFRDSLESSNLDGESLSERRID